MINYIYSKLFHEKYKQEKRKYLLNFSKTDFDRSFRP